MAEHVSRLEELARKVEIMQRLLNETRRSNRETFQKHDSRLNSLEHLEDRVTEGVRRTMDDAAQQWWARLQQHHRSEVARQTDLLREQMMAVEQDLKTLYAQHVAKCEAWLDQVQRTAADCVTKVETVRGGLDKREARLATLERRCREMMDEQAFRKENSLPVTFARRSGETQSQGNPVGSRASSPAGSAGGRASSRCPSDAEIRTRLDSVNERLRAYQAHAEGRGRQAVRMVAEAQKTALKARSCSVEPALVLRVEAEAGRLRRNRSYSGASIES
ncbi:HERC1 [Symbiodinium sp. CCMP2592]|nr:HERC1 [Symbiodinium sp. CCMP2592]